MAALQSHLSFPQTKFGSRDIRLGPASGLGEAHRAYLAYHERACSTWLTALPEHSCRIGTGRPSGLECRASDLGRVPARSQTPLRQQTRVFLKEGAGVTCGAADAVLRATRKLVVLCNGRMLRRGSGSMSKLFDMQQLALALEQSQADVLRDFYTDDATMRIVDRDRPPSKPLVIAGGRRSPSSGATFVRAT